MSRRALLVVLTVSATVLTPVAVAQAAPDPDAPPARGGAITADFPGALERPVQADENGDHVSDDFEARLASARPGERLAVIVTGFGSAKARTKVGSFTLKRELPIVNGFAATMTAAQARGLLRVPGIRRVEADGVMRVVDDATNRDYGATAARADRAGLDGAGSGICIIDTGIDPGHEQIAPPSGQPSRIVRFADFVASPDNLNATPYDDHGHGTHVSAIAAGDGNGPSADAATFMGVAPAAELYGAKVMAGDGSGQDSDIIAGIDWCHSQAGVDVLSMSIGDPIGGDGTDAVSKAVDAAATSDVVVVAAGNGGDSYQTIHAPAVARGAIAVGAASDYSAPVGTDRHDDGIFLAGFSSRGPTSDGRTKPEVVAPGVTVTSAEAGTTSGYVTWDGTSMATPYVSGAVALALQASPGATPSQVRSALTGTAVDVGQTGQDNDWGYGMIDVRAFVDALAGTTPARGTGFPARWHSASTVPDNGYVDIPITVDSADVGLTFAVMMTIRAGTWTCDIWCQAFGGAGEWSPDIDMELRDPQGQVVGTSDCTAPSLSCGAGRQETIGFRPSKSGEYTLHVYPYSGKGGNVFVDVSHGPRVDGSTTQPPPPPSTNQPPIVNAGADRTVLLAKRAKSASFTLSGTASDADGTIQSMTWRDGTTVLASGTGSALSTTVSRKAGTYTFTLTATDNNGATGSDQVVVTVTR